MGPNPESLLDHRPTGEPGVRAQNSARRVTMLAAGTSTGAVIRGPRFSLLSLSHVALGSP